MTGKASTRFRFPTIVAQGLVLALIGIGVGLDGALALTRLMASLLLEVSPTDPQSFALIAVLLLGAAVLACWVPARRAARVAPMVSLRYE